MISDTTRFHKTLFQEVDVLKIYVFVRIWVVFDPLRYDSGPGVNAGGIYVKIIVIGIENSSFGYELTTGNVVKGVSFHLREDPQIFKLCPLEESASHHKT